MTIRKKLFTGSGAMLLMLLAMAVCLVSIGLASELDGMVSGAAAHKG